MTPMKWPLLINHIGCSLFDTIICTMSTPYFFFQNTGFLGVGLLSWLKISNLLQIFIIICFGVFMAGSYLFMFESRSNILPMNRFRLKTFWKRFSYHVSVLMVNFTLLTLLVRTPVNQDAAKLESLKIDPCPTREFFQNEVLIVMPNIDAIKFTVLFHGPFLLIHIFVHGLFHVICTVYHLYVTSVHSISPETRRNQQKFFIGIVAQTIIPLSLVVIILVVILSVGIREQITQEFMNLTIIFFAMHGLVESITVLMVHRSYRRAVWRIISKRKKVSVTIQGKDLRP